MTGVLHTAGRVQIRKFLYTRLKFQVCHFYVMKTFVRRCRPIKGQVTQVVATTEVSVTLTVESHLFTALDR